MPTVEERLKALEDWQAANAGRVSSMWTRLSPPEPPGPIERIGYLEEDLAALQRSAERHIHSNNCSDRTTGPTIPGAAAAPPGPGGALEVADTHMAVVAVYPAGTVAAEGPLPVPWGSDPAPIARYWIGAGHHRIHPSQIPAFVKADHPGVDFAAVDMAAVPIWGPGREAVTVPWRHIEPEDG